MTQPPPRVSDDTLDGLDEMAGAVAIKGPLLRQLIAEIRSSRAGDAQREANERRYLWLRDIAPQNFPWGPYVVGCPGGAALDAEIDAAISAAQGKCK